MIYYYNVSVIVPTTLIVGGSEYHVDKGSAIQLTCVIKNVSRQRVTTFELAARLPGCPVARLPCCSAALLLTAGFQSIFTLIYY